MNTFLTDSMARDHANTMLATAAATRRAREARLARRQTRRAVRAARAETHSRTAAVGHAAARPFVATKHWLVAGHL